MSTVKMPEPVAFRWRVPIDDSDGRQCGESDWKLGTEKGGLPWWTQDSLITTTQAEAYADARVREALRAEVAAMREALEEIRSRSAMNFAMRPDPFALTAELGDIHQIADAAIDAAVRKEGK